MNTNTTDHGPTVEGYEVVELVPGHQVAALVAERDGLREALEELAAKCEERGFHPMALQSALTAIAKATGG